MSSEHEQTVRFLQIYLQVRDAGADVPFGMAAEVAKAARKSCLPDAVFRGLARDSKRDVRAAVAANPSCPQELLRSLADDPDRVVRKAVAANPSCPEDLLCSLARDEDWSVRAAVAANPGCPEDPLRSLAKDEGWQVRAAVARNPGCPVDLLRSLARDEDWSVQGAVAENPGCPEDVLRSLARDEGWRVRAGVARNPGCPVDLLRSLTRDKEWLVQKAARNNLSGKANPNTNSTAADSFHIPEKYAPVFASPVDPDAALAAIRSRGEGKQFLQAALAANPATSIELLRRLARCKNMTVWKLLAEHPNADDKLRAAIARKILMAA